jgi:hypothetical protein
MQVTEPAIRAPLVGVIVGAAIGATGRLVVTSLHLSSTTEETALVLAAAGVAGTVIGALAGLPGTPLAGAIVGVVVSVLLYLGTLPVVMLFHFLGTLAAPSLLEVAMVGALAGCVAGLASRWAERRAAPPPSSAGRS